MLNTTKKKKDLAGSQQAPVVGGLASLKERIPMTFQARFALAYHTPQTIPQNLSFFLFGTAWPSHPVL